MKESIEEFLARGGKIKQIPRGVSGMDDKKQNRHIIISKKADPNYDPRAARKADNQKMFNRRKNEDE